MIKTDIKRFNLYTILGIGIGLIISTLFFLLYPQNIVLSDKLVLERAADLGFVTASDYEKLQNELLEYQQKFQTAREEVRVITTVTIPEGANSTQIAGILLENNIIKNVEDFHKLATLLQIDTKFKAKTYELNEDIDLGELILILTDLK